MKDDMNTVMYDDEEEDCGYIPCDAINDPENIVMARELREKREQKNE